MRNASVIANTSGTVARLPAPRTALGKGGFGEVWKCEAPGGIHKAVKFVRNKSNGLNPDGANAQLELQLLEYVRSVRYPPFSCRWDRIEVIDGVLIVVMELAGRKFIRSVLRHYQSIGHAGVPREAASGPTRARRRKFSI